MIRMEQNTVESRSHRHHARHEANPFDLAIGPQVKIEPGSTRTNDKGRSFELLVAPRSLRKTAGRPEIKAA